MFSELLDRGAGLDRFGQPWSVPRLNEHLNRDGLVVTAATLYRWQNAEVHPRRGMLRDVVSAWGLNDEDTALLWQAHRAGPKAATSPVPLDRTAYKEQQRSPIKIEKATAKSYTNRSIKGREVTASKIGQRVAKIAAALEAFKELDSRLGGGSVSRSVEHFLHEEVAPLLVTPTESDDTDTLFAATASLIDLAGWMSHDAGDDTQAYNYFERGYRLAQIAEAPLLAASISASMAHLAVEIGQPERALNFATAGLSHANEGEEPFRLSARLLVLSARAYALKGESRECINAIERGQESLAIAGNMPTPSWTPRFDSGSFSSEAALSLLELGEFNEAEAHVENILALRGSREVRSRALAQLTLARIRVTAGEYHSAADLGSDILSDVGYLDSIRVKYKLSQLGVVLSEFDEVKEVSYFLEKLADAHMIY